MARLIWKGAVAFGIASIPVRLYSAIRGHGPHFAQLQPTRRTRSATDS